MNVDKSMLKTAEDLVSYARSKGADQAQVKLQQGDEFSVSVQQGKIDKLSEAGSKTASIKIIKAERVINLSSSDLDPATLRGLVDRGLERVVLLSPDPYSALPPLEAVEVNPDSLKIYDEAVEALTPRQKIDRALTMESIALADKRSRSRTAPVSRPTSGPSTSPIRTASPAPIARRRSRATSFSRRETVTICSTKARGTSPAACAI